MMDTSGGSNGVGGSGSASTAPPCSAAANAATALWGAGSLKERFGSLSGRELQEHLFQMYQVADCLFKC